MTKAIREKPILMCGEMVLATLADLKTNTRRVLNPQPQDGWVPDTVGRYCPAIEKPNGELTDGPEIFGACNEDLGIKCPYGAPGDRLWVRETFYIDDITLIGERLPKLRPDDLIKDQIYYRADGECCEQIPECQCATEGKPSWRPSIFMPRWASRINLEITDIRVERVQDISEADAMAEGVRRISEGTGDEVFNRKLCPQCGGTGLYTANSMAGASFDTDCDLCDTYKKRFRLLWDSINTDRGFGWGVNPWVWVVEFRRVAS